VIRGWAAWAALAIGLSMAWFGFTSGPSVPHLVPAAVHPRSAPTAVGTSPSLEPLPTARGAAPVGIRIPTLGVEAPVVPVDVGPDRFLTVPDDPAVVGWWREGASPGSGAGSVVLDGHVDTHVNGPGAFFRLAELEAGDDVVLETTNGTPTYRVVSEVLYPKEQLPLDVFDPSGDPRLVLISCGGPFDRTLRRYTDNVVVSAVPLASVGP
jgi:sortase (surface protein transpeptidase)